MTSITRVLRPEFEYTEEWLKYSMDREKGRTDFLMRSPQLKSRPKLIQTIKRLCSKYDLCLEVTHLSVYIMDYFMDNHDISEDIIELTPICSLAIAAKVLEIDRMIPQFKQLVPNKYSMEEFIKLEIIILKYFDWILLTPTTATYIEYFCDKCLSDLQMNANIKELVEKYLNKTIDPEFYAFKPSLIAASTLYCTRDALNLHPIWPKGVKNITNYSLNQIQECVEKIRKSEKGFKQKRLKTLITTNCPNDSGFIDLNESFV